MTFDINKNIFDDFFNINPRKARQYKKELLRDFQKSPEWQQIKAQLNMPSPEWIDLFIDFLFNDISLGLPNVHSRIIEDFLYDYIPRSVVLNTEDAEPFLTEFKAFWMYLKREHNLYFADECLRVLERKNLPSKFQKRLNDPHLHGPSKKFALAALEAGVDLHNTESMNNFMEVYNRRIRKESRTPASEKVQKKHDAIITIMEPICREHLTEAYLQLAKKMADTLAKLKPSPLEKGREKTWAAAIVYAIGQVNFLFDPSQKPHLKATELCKLFEVSQSAAGGKATEIGEILDLMPFHPDWTLPENQDRNPLLWYHMIDGLLTDIRKAPPEIQKMAYERGLIPYIPSDKGQDA